VGSNPIVRTKLTMTTHDSLEEFGTDIPELNSPKPRSSTDSHTSPPAPPSADFSLTFDAPRHRALRWTEVSKDMFLSSPETVKKIVPGVYKYVRFVDSKHAFQKIPINVDELLIMPDSLSESIISEIQDFLDRADKFKFYGFLHRRGFLFYGPHGSGKSSLVQQIIKKVVDQDGVVLLCEHPVLLELGLTDLRRVEPDRFIVCLFEDIDALIRCYGEKEILAVLDGENQINKVLNIATTNYPEVLDPRIVARPRRFDKVIKIDWPNKSVRRHYFKHKLKIDDSEMESWVEATDRFSFAACAELVISVKCLGRPFKKAVEELRILMDDRPNSKDYDIKGVKFGFSPEKR
jgi:hypothetical protein